MSLIAELMRRTLSILVVLGLLSGQAALAARPADAPCLSLPASIRSFDLVTVEQGWLLAGDRLYATGDAGTSWQEITPHGGTLLPCAEPRLAAAAFPDPQSGMAVLACPDSSGTGAAALARTADGGRTWSLLPMPGQAADAIASPSGAVHLQLVDARTAWLVADALTSSNFSQGRLFATDDGGETWSEHSLPIGGRVSFADAQTGWAAGGATGSELYRTGDGGRTWVDLSPSPSEGEGGGEGRSPLYQLPTLLDAGRALLPVTLPTAEDSLVRLYATEDGGIDWRLAAELDAAAGASPGVAVPVAPLDAARWLLRLPGSDALLRIGPSGTGSSGWTVVTLAQGPMIARIRTLDMANDSMGWALAQWGSCSTICRQESVLLRTTDGGVTWTSLAGTCSTEVSMPCRAPRHTEIAVMPAEAGIQEPGTPATPGVEGMPLHAAETGGLGRHLTTRTRAITGHGFDTCEAPSLEALHAWMDDSPYRAVNLYIGGVNRACDNVRLAPDYVEGLAAQGWTFIPTWVGPQAACWGYPGAKMSYDPAAAFEEGRAEADAAVSAAIDLDLAGPGEGTVLYYDLEAYNTGNSPCRQAASAFIRGWTERLQELGQVAGGYGAGCASAPSDWAELPSPPDVLWAAHWVYDSYAPEASVWDVACLSNSLWPDHQRVRQYTGGHNEVWGTTNLTIDCDVLDGIVADVREVWRCEEGEPCWYLYLPSVLGP